MKRVEVLGKRVVGNKNLDECFKQVEKAASDLNDFTTRTEGEVNDLEKEKSLIELQIGHKSNEKGKSAAAVKNLAAIFKTPVAPAVKNTITKKVDPLKKPDPSSVDDTVDNNDTDKK